MSYDKTKPVYIVIEPSMDAVNAKRAELLKTHVKYSDDFVETADAVYFVRAMSVDFEMDKLLLKPQKDVQYDIQAWIDALDAKVAEIKKLTGYNPGNVTNTPPPEFQNQPTMPPVAPTPDMPVGGTAVSDNHSPSGQTAA